MKAVAPGLLQIETAEEFAALADAAQSTFSLFFQMAIREILTRERCAEVRTLRVDESHSWRGVAQVCFDRWGGSWSPPSNQLMGMALCEAAALAHSEDYMEAPWN